MKKLIVWLAKVFNANIEVEKIVVKEVIKEVVEYRYLSQGTIEGDVYVDGNLIINGELNVKGGVTIFRKEK